MDLSSLRLRRQEVLDCATGHGACNIRVFGSIARGEADPASDIDLLVTMEAGRNLMDLVGLQQDLEDLLGQSVDVLSDGGVSPYMRDRIFAEAMPL